MLATRISPASPNFGQAKHGQNGPAATDCQQCIFYPICGHHFTHRTHTDISFRFRPGGRRLKNFHFSRNSIAARVFFCRPAADSILMPPTFPIARWNVLLAQYTRQCKRMADFACGYVSLRFWHISIQWSPYDQLLSSRRRGGN